MGKNLKGKNCGKGISQKKDSSYQARFVSKNGKRYSKTFKTLPEAKRWLVESQYADQIQLIPPPKKTTVDAWFEFWINNLVQDRAPNTLRNYRERYENNIKPLIGRMNMNDVKPMHCKAILNKMENEYAGSTMRQTYITISTIFRAAMDNDVVTKIPLKGVSVNKPIKALDDIHCLTLDEQRKFLEAAKRSHNYRQYALILETGLRTGELIGLTWDCIDWEKRTLTVNKTLEFRYKSSEWRAGPTKTKQSYRTIPLTNRAFDLLAAAYMEKDSRKESPLLDQQLSYMDRRSGIKKTMCMRDLVFVNFRTGMPSKNSSYDTHLYKLCDEANIPRFCMHALRHTFATRAIERGVNPKTLQKLLGHASVKTTMDRYVHVTDDSIRNAIALFEQNDVEKQHQIDTCFVHSEQQKWCENGAKPF